MNLLQTIWQIYGPIFKALKISILPLKGYLSLGDVLPQVAVKTYVNTFNG